MQIILGICCLFESFLLSWAVLAAQVWPRALASVLPCPEPLLSKHLWGSCGGRPLFSREQSKAQAAPQSRAGGSAQQTHPCQREQPPQLDVQRSWRGTGKLLDPQAVEGLPLLPLKSITPFPLGSLGTGPSAWLVVKAHIIAAFMEAWSLIDRQRGIFSKQISARHHSLFHLCLLDSWGLGQGPDSGLTITAESRLLDNLAPGLSSSLRSWCWLQPKGAQASTTGLSPGWKEAYEKKQTLKMFPSSSVTEEVCEVWALKIPGNNQWVRNTVGKLRSCSLLASLAGFGTKPGSWTTPLSLFASLLGFLHFAHHETYCKTNSRKLSEMVLQVC